MTTRFPDIEIYVKQPSLEQLESWLTARFGETSSTRRGEGLVYTLGPDRIECVIFEHATKGGYTSVWFKSDQTPWEDDRACALDAYEQLGLEVRCSTGSWSEDEDAGWLSVSEKGETRIHWD